MSTFSSQIIGCKNLIVADYMLDKDLFRFGWLLIYFVVVATV